MSLASKFRWVGKFTPTYGKCGGMQKACAFKRDDLDPLDQLFYDHDWRFYEAEHLNDPYETDAVKKEADTLLHKAIAALTDEDMKKIPFLTLEFPFFKRHYAKKYRKACLQIFKPKD